MCIQIAVDETRGLVKASPRLYRPALDHQNRLIDPVIVIGIGNPPLIIDVRIEFDARRIAEPLG